MKIQLMRIIVCMLLILPVFSFTTVANLGPKLVISIKGSLPFRYFNNFVCGVIGNYGDATAYDISYNMTIQGGVDGAINKRIAGYEGEILPNNAFAIPITDTNGFGSVTVTMTASSSNTETTTGIAKGFQIGSFTWIPFSWLSP